jgi:purine-nucleoside phosphorylase
MDQYEKALEAYTYLSSLSQINPKIGLILGSGLGSIVEEMTDKIHISFEQIPHFEKISTEGHLGEVVLGKLNGVEVIALNGRYHYYDGYPLTTITFPVRVMRLFGAQTLILTNACGAINMNFKPGDLMIIEDHLNLVSNNPLIGKNINEFGPRFPDASEIYTKPLRKIARTCASELGFSLQQGVYAWWSGPSYETPAEIKMIRILGADAVGMSTVPEALVASHMGMKVLGISCLTNMASGILDQKLSHQEVLEVAASVHVKFRSLIKKIVKNI